MTELLILVSIALTFAIIPIIDTLTWVIRASASVDKSQIISLSNIFQYSSRLFYFSLILFLSIYLEHVETNNPQSMIISFIAGVLVTVATHAFLIYNKKSLAVFIRIVEKSFKKTQQFKEISLSEIKPIHNSEHKSIFFGTAITTAILSLSISLPFIAAIHFKEYRLTITNLTQVINFFGTFYIIYYVESELFKKMDYKSIEPEITSYIKGRLLGYSLPIIIYTTMLFI